MDEITTDAAIMAVLGRQMTRAVQRQAVAASNLANLDTPGYRAQEIQFGSLLDEQLAQPTLVATDPQHFGTPAGVTDRADVQETQNIAPRRDGNTVQLDRELLALTRAAGDFSAAQTVLSAKFRLVRYAINEGR